MGSCSTGAKSASSGLLQDTPLSELGSLAVARFPGPEDDRAVLPHQGSASSERPARKPPSAWLALGPSLVALTAVSRLFDAQRTAPAWIYIALLVGGLAMVVWVLVLRGRQPGHPLA